MHSFAYETAGAARTRSSLRPLISRANEMQNFGQIMPRECEVVLEGAVIARNSCDEAIHSFFTRRDGLLRFARNDGEGPQPLPPIRHFPLAAKRSMVPLASRSAEAYNS